jgi:hypothetical protein
VFVIPNKSLTFCCINEQGFAQKGKTIMAEEFDVTVTSSEPGTENIPRYGEKRSTPVKEGERLVRDVKEQGKGMLADQKMKAAAMIGDLANALHASARQLDEQAHPNSAHYLEQAAGSLERFSGNLRQRDIDELTFRVREFARRQPVLLLAGALVTGFYVARLLKSGTRYERSEEVSPLTRETAGEFTGEIPLH